MSNLVKDVFYLLSRLKDYPLWVVIVAGIIFLSGAVLLVIYYPKSNLSTDSSSPSTSLDFQGLVKIAANGQDFKTPVGVGDEFRALLKPLSQEADWYIITINPEGFVAGDFFDDIILPALRRGVRLK